MGSPRETGACLAAYWQHLFALSLHDIGHERRWSMTRLGEVTGLGGNLRHIVNGTRTLNLAQMLAAVAALDAVDLIPPADDMAGLTPPGW